MANNFLARYFNSKKESPLQVDGDGLYYGSLDKKYQYRYYVLTEHWYQERKPQVSEWTYEQPSQFICRCKRMFGKPITIMNISTKIVGSSED